MHNIISYLSLKSASVKNITSPFSLLFFLSPPKNDGVQHLFLHRNDLGKEADAQTAYSQHTEVCQHQSRKHAVNGGQLSDIHHGARGDALHDKGTQQDRGDGVAGNTQRQPV